MKFSHIRALVEKEFYQIIRDPSSILIAFVLPIMLIILFAYAISLDISRMKIGLVLEDDSNYAQTLAGAYISNSFFDAQVARDRRAFESDLVSGHIRGIIIIPQDFGKTLEQGQIKPLEVITDGSEPNTANFIQNYALAVWNNWSSQQSVLSGRQSAGNLSVESRIWYNPELESRHFLLPAALALIMTLIGSLLTGLVVSREWERGTMEALLSTTITRGEFLLGKLIPYFFLGVLSIILSSFIIIWVFQTPFRGSVLSLVICGSVFLFTALGMGLLISTLAKNQFVACQVTFITAFMPTLLLSGFIFEINSMPLILRMITHIIPAKYLIACLQSIFMVGDVMAILIPNICYMAIVAATFLTLTLVKTRTRLE